MDEQMIERIAEALWRAEWAVGHEPAYSWDALCAEDESIADAFRAQAHAAHSVMSARLAELEEALEWFGTDTRLSLEHYSPIYCDDDDQSVEWRVHKQTGSINDREWDIVGRGETPLAAIITARAALAPHPKGTDQ